MSWRQRHASLIRALASDACACGLCPVAACDGRLIFFFTYAKWEVAREAQVSGLRDGTLTAACDTFACKVNQAVIKVSTLGQFVSLRQATAVLDVRLRCGYVRAGSSAR